MFWREKGSQFDVFELTIGFIKLELDYINCPLRLEKKIPPKYPHDAGLLG